MIIDTILGLYIGLNFNFMRTSEELVKLNFQEYNTEQKNTSQVQIIRLRSQSTKKKSWHHKKEMVFAECKRVNVIHVCVEVHTLLCNAHNESSEEISEKTKGVQRKRWKDKLEAHWFDLWPNRCTHRPTQPCFHFEDIYSTAPMTTQLISAPRSIFKRSIINIISVFVAFCCMRYPKTPTQTPIMSNCVYLLR